MVASLDIQSSAGRVRASPLAIKTTSKATLRAGVTQAQRCIRRCGPGKTRARQTIARKANCTVPRVRAMYAAGAGPARYSPSVHWKLRTTPKLTSSAPIRNIQRAAGSAGRRKRT